jgi:hypothetical protein
MRASIKSPAPPILPGGEGNGGDCSEEYVMQNVIKDEKRNKVEMLNY